LAQAIVAQAIFAQAVVAQVRTPHHRHTRKLRVSPQSLS